MATTITELQQLCAGQGVPLPELRRAATALDGTPVYAAGVDGSTAFSLWRDLRALHERSGWWPVLAGESLDRVFTGLEPSFAPSGGIAADVPPDGDELLADWAREAEKYLDEAGRTPPGEDPFAREAQELATRLESRTDPEPDEPLQLRAMYRECSSLVLVQAPAGHDVPALLNWLGACNHDISGTQHRAVLRHFHERYGAELVTLEDDVIELLVTRRPRTPDDIARAALQQYAYCSDIVDQGIGSVEELAAIQVRGATWYFWWD